MPPAAADQSTGASNLPTISADGQVVAFTSSGWLAPDSQGANEAIYVRDRSNGTTTLVNRTLDGAASEFPVYGLALSANGQVVAYFSHDGRLVADDELDCGIPEDPISCEDLFIYQRADGSTARLALGRGQGLGKDYTVALSADGRLVAHGATVWEWASGQAETAPTVDGQPPVGHTFAPQFGGEGRYLAFISAAANLVPDDTNDAYDVFIWDRQAGTVERVSMASDGSQADDISGALPFHEGIGHALALAADGRFVAFTSLASNLSPEPLAQCDDPFTGAIRPCYPLYLHDRQTGETRALTPQANGDSQSPTLSAAGRWLAFASLATNLTDDSLPACQFPAMINCAQIYLLDTAENQLRLVSRASEGNGVTAGNGGSWQVDLSAEGDQAAFVSTASNLVAGDTNDVADIFLFEPASGQVTRVSLKSQALLP